MAVLEHWRSSWMCPDCPWHSLSCNPPPPHCLHVTKGEVHIAWCHQRGRRHYQSSLIRYIQLVWEIPNECNIVCFIAKYPLLSASDILRGTRPRTNWTRMGEILDESWMGLSKLCHAWIILIETFVISVFVWSSSDYIFRCDSISQRNYPCKSVSQWVGNIFRFPCQSDQCQQSLYFEVLPDTFKYFWVLWGNSRYADIFVNLKSSTKSGNFATSSSSVRDIATLSINPKKQMHLTIWKTLDDLVILPPAFPRYCH